MAMDKSSALRETGGEGWKVGKYGGKLGIALRGGEVGPIGGLSIMRCWMDGRSGVTRIASAEMERWVGRRCGEIFLVVGESPGVVSGIVSGCMGG